ncbi:MAG: hypothetical protein ACRC62_33040 [Microcoleus sp.]
MSKIKIGLQYFAALGSMLVNVVLWSLVFAFAKKLEIELTVIDNLAYILGLAAQTTVGVLAVMYDPNPHGNLLRHQKENIHRLDE